MASEGERDDGAANWEETGVPGPFQGRLILCSTLDPPGIDAEQASTSFNAHITCRGPAQMGVDGAIGSASFSISAAAASVA